MVDFQAEVHYLTFFLSLLGLYGINMGKSVGSGTIIDGDGTILTCAHVVADFQGRRPLSIGKVWYPIVHITVPADL